MATGIEAKNLPRKSSLAVTVFFLMEDGTTSAPVRYSIQEFLTQHIQPLIGTGGIAWGAITGAINSQADLIALLNTYQLKSEKGNANGYAPLGADSKVSWLYLPSAADDVVYGSNLAAFPPTGENGKLYVAEDSGITYRWNGTNYIATSTAFVVIGSLSATDNINAPSRKAVNDALALKEDKINKDASNGYVGLTLFNINFKNVAGTIVSNFTNTNNASRTYTFPDKTGIVALTSDIPTTITIAKTANFTMLAAENGATYLVTTGAANINVTNMASPVNGNFFFVSKVDAGTGTVILNGGSFVINRQNQVVKIYFNGAAWITDEVDQGFIANNTLLANTTGASARATENQIVDLIENDTAVINNLSNSANWTGVNYTGPSTSSPIGKWYVSETYSFFCFGVNQWSRHTRI